MCYVYGKIDGLSGCVDLTCTHGTKCLRSGFLNTDSRQHFKEKSLRREESLSGQRNKEDVIWFQMRTYQHCPWAMEHELNLESSRPGERTCLLYLNVSPQFLFIPRDSIPRCGDSQWALAIWGNSVSEPLTAHTQLGNGHAGTVQSCVQPEPLTLSYLVTWGLGFF